MSSENYGRRRFVGSAISFLALPRVLAQSQEGTQNRVDESRGYTPPSAAKSVEIGTYYLHRKNYAGALDRFKEATTTDPYCAPGYLGLGKVYDKLGLPQKALVNYRRYLELLPSQKQDEEAKDVHRAIERLEKRASSGSTVIAGDGKKAPDDK